MIQRLSTGSSTSRVASPRTYDSRLRRERAEQTRQRILDAAVDLLRASSIRDWTAVTIRAVAEGAEVSERTVYRHFDSERGLRDAVLERFTAEAGVDLDSLRLDDVADVATRIVQHVSAYPIVRQSPGDPTLDVAGRRQRDALIAAVGAAVPDLRERDRVAAAAVLDALWSTATYERLAADWQLDTEAVIEAITWAIGLVTAAVRDCSTPGPAIADAWGS